jgi:signal transduction histidine kinase
MLTQERTGTPDTRIISRVYAAFAGLGGFLIFAWGPMWFGADLPGLPFGKAGLVRVFGSILTASGCWAAMLSQIEDSFLRRRALMWFTAAHSIVLLVIYTQQLAIFGPGLASVVNVLSAITLGSLTLLFYGEDYFRDSALDRMRPRTKTGAAEPIRSRYERQIREAAAQEERNRLARDLHDSIKQQIFVIQTAAATAQARFDDDRAGAALALSQIRDSARDAMTEMEAMMDQLRSVPLENAGLTEALKKLCEALGHRTGIKVEFKVGDLPPNETLLPGSHQALLRVAQEALANIGRHARASSVTVSLDSLSDRLELRIRDDGVGFDPSSGQSGMGIRNMRSRAEEFGGQFDLATSQGKGTTVTFSVPHLEFTPAAYRRNALLYGAVFLFGVVVSAKAEPGIRGFWVAISVLMFARSAHAWRQTGKYGKARA